MASALEEAWQANLEELKKFKRQNGHCRVPESYISESGKKLGTWAANQRNRQGQLSQDRIDALTAIGFSWSLSDESWQHNFELLEEHKREHGDCRVSTTGGTALGRWVHRQRHYYKTNKLSDERTQKLDSIGFVWDASKDRKTSGPAQGRPNRNEDAAVPSARVALAPIAPKPNNGGNRSRDDPETSSSSAPKKRKTATPETENERRLRVLLEKRDKTIARQKEVIQRKDAIIAALKEENWNKAAKTTVELEGGNETGEQNQKEDDIVVLESPISTDCELYSFAKV